MDDVPTLSLLSIQIAREASLVPTERPSMSGIHKLPVRNADVDEFGLMGDTIVDTEHHGGHEQAVYIYAADDYAWWSEQLSLELAPGTFGENLTIDTFGGEVRIGDRFAFGAPATDGSDDAQSRQVVLEATSCRIPCGTFSARMQQPDWIRRFRDARRPGVYCRVINGGALTTGDPVARIAHPSSPITILDTQDLFYESPKDRSTEWINAALDAPLQDETRAQLIGELARRTASAIPGKPVPAHPPPPAVHRPAKACNLAPKPGCAAGLRR